MKNVNRTLSGVATALLAICATGFSANAQAVIFPQPAQPGIAQIDEEASAYVISNDLFAARFVQDADGHLIFGGSQELGLIAGTPIFKIELGDGTRLSGSDLVPTSVKTVDLTADPEAVRASLKYPGKALEATYTYGDLDITWRAVLRDGSHYLRTEMDLSANGTPVAMKSVTPLTYSVDAVTYSAPAVVGNTRGAMLASEHIFAGAETPTAYNSIVGDEKMGSHFSHKGWTPDMWEWTPGKSEVPAAIAALAQASKGVKGGRGYVSVREAGDCTFTFNYTGGRCRLNMLGVDMINPATGAIVASDYHFGYTGNQKVDNVYTLRGLEQGVYILRYFVATSEELNSSGTIAVSKNFGPVKVIYDLAPGSTPAQAPARFAAAAAEGADAYELGSSKTYTWGPLDDGKWLTPTDAQVPYRIIELGVNRSQLRYMDFPVSMADKGDMDIVFQYSSGNHRLDMAGVALLDANGDEVALDYHTGYTGTKKENNTYAMKVPYAGNFTLRVWSCGNGNNTNGNINVAFDRVDELHLPAPSTVEMEGLWSRNTRLLVDDPWQVGAVVGLIAPGQARRSVAAYVERERAVAWRSMPVYNSWYELNINRNNAQDYKGNMTVEQCVEVVKQWKEHLTDVYGTQLGAYVWDDGWDEYGTWGFNPNFPNGFDEIAQVTDAMQAGIGAWLGPVGGYGQSRGYRRAYWNGKGGMQLSNPAYYEVFTNAIKGLVDRYDFRFFKFDGISAQQIAYGPDAGDTGNENAEGIIRAERAVRQMKPDIFFNTTVGTWASPFWFGISDCVWRQQNDCAMIGNNPNKRERWITYRDHMVYDIFVTQSPLCPINSLMTHGFLLSKFGEPDQYNKDFDSVVREMRCAFACGTNMVEVYADFSLMNDIQNADGVPGMLWKELDDCIRWHREVADVLPDAHWVGGNPWTGAKAEVYGWASWNAKKATLALRNGATNEQTFATTLREALEIPDGWNTSITLTPAFADQAAIDGLPEGPIDIDQELSLKLPANSVYVFNGVDNNPVDLTVSGVDSVEAAPAAPVRTGIYDLMGRRLSAPVRGSINIINGKKTLVK